MILLFYGSFGLKLLKIKGKVPVPFGLKYEKESWILPPNKSLLYGCCFPSSFSVFKVSVFVVYGQKCPDM